MISYVLFIAAVGRIACCYSGSEFGVYGSVRFLAGVRIVPNVAGLGLD